MTRTILVGAGNIAQSHAAALAAVPGVDVVGIIDPRLEQAEALARRFKDCRAYQTLEGFLNAAECDAAHILVPPDHHTALAAQLVRRGVRALIEKPIAQSLEECELLQLAARSSLTSGSIYVNHNFVFHPAFAKLASLIEQKKHGPLTALSVTYAMPIRQITAGQFYHWMFQRPVNLLLEQAVHPLSQIVALAGPIESIKSIAGPGTKVNDRQEIPGSISAMLRCRDADVQLVLQFGSTFRRWHIAALCADGVIEADMTTNTVFAHTRTQWIEPLDNYLSARSSAHDQTAQELKNLTHYLKANLGLGKSADAFLASMKGSIAAFYSRQTPFVNSLEGATGLIRACEEIARETFPMRALPVPSSPVARTVIRSGETVVIGGTGFIGRHIVRNCIERGAPVRVISRHNAGLPNDFDSPLVTFTKADIGSSEDLERALRGARYVINCAGPALADSWERTEPGVRQSMANLAEACSRAHVERLVHLSSTAALYLGEQSARIVGSDPVDQCLDQRPLYSRAKALSETHLRELAGKSGLSLCVLRPAIVVGEFGMPYHSGVGIFVNERHFIGWNAGDNPLPFVLASDVASAAIAACERPEADGKSYNLVGDVSLSAKAYVEELGRVLERPLAFHPQSTSWLWATELAKFGVKYVAGRAGLRTTLRDLRSRSFLSQLDASDAKQDLAWFPVSDRDVFINAALKVHRRAGATQSQTDRCPQPSSLARIPAAGSE